MPPKYNKHYKGNYLLSGSSVTVWNHKLKSTSLKNVHVFIILECLVVILCSLIYYYVYMCNYNHIPKYNKYSMQERLSSRSSEVFLYTLFLLHYLLFLISMPPWYLLIRQKLVGAEWFQESLLKVAIHV